MTPQQYLAFHNASMALQFARDNAERAMVTSVDPYMRERYMMNCEEELQNAARFLGYELIKQPEAVTR